MSEICSKKLWLNKYLWLRAEKTAFVGKPVLHNSVFHEYEWLEFREKSLCGMKSFGWN